MTIPVQVVAATSRPLSVERSVSGTVTADRDSKVAARTGGVVQRLLVREGDTVTAGQLIVQLDDTDLRQSLESARLQAQSARINLQQGTRTTGQDVAQLRAAVQAAQASYDKASQTARSNRELLALGGISRADVTASEAQLSQAQADLVRAQNALRQNGQSGSGSAALLQNQLASAEVSVRQAEQNLSHAQIRAPFAGVVADLPVGVGEYLQAGGTAFRLVDPGSLKVEFGVSPADASALPAGTAVNLSYGAQKLTGRVGEGEQVAGSDRLVPIRVRLDGQPSLPVGGTVQVRYRLRLGGGLLVPTTAIQNDTGANTVYVLQDGVARRRPVTVVAESQGQAVVSGLTAGAQVISPVPPSLADGASVRAGQ
ncbi:efflux RND transporter periplasmic adaptor subunit [Deinococcus sonorensis]|uniref:Efflux RND transporter periplasmic adaptor subunit n=1 Tax=Deinococcus sonorensis KR-87 TaxID=694439 RepID=A0AAU7UC43_9DEIO